MVRLRREHVQSSFVKIAQRAQARTLLRFILDSWIGNPVHPVPSLLAHVPARRVRCQMHAATTRIADLLFGISRRHGLRPFPSPFSTTCPILDPLVWISCAASLTWQWLCDANEKPDLAPMSRNPLSLPGSSRLNLAPAQTQNAPPRGMFSYVSSVYIYILYLSGTTRRYLYRHDEIRNVL